MDWFTWAWNIHYNYLFGSHQLRGYQGTSPLGLQVFIGTADERLLKPHAFYQVHRITGKTVTTPSLERLINGTKVLEIPLEPKNHMKVVWVKHRLRAFSITRHKCSEYVAAFHHKSFACDLMLFHQSTKTTVVIYCSTCRCRDTITWVVSVMCVLLIFHCAKSSFNTMSYGCSW